MDHHSYHAFNYYQQTPSSGLPPYYAPASPSDFIYNSSANATASIFRPSRPSVPGDSWLDYSAMGYGPSRPVEQSYPTYLSGPSLPEPSLPEPTPGLAEHRRQRQRDSAMNVGPGPSKLVPPPLSLSPSRGSDSGESTVVIKQEEVSSSPVLVSMPMKKWEPREPRMPTKGPGQQIKVDGKGKGKERLFDPFGNAGLENGIGGGRGSGSGSGSDAWEERGEGVMERVIPPVVPSMGIDTGMEIQMEMGMGMKPGIEGNMGMGMEPTIMPKMGLFKPIRWDGPSSSFSASRSSRSSKVKARRTRAWEAFEEDGGDVHLQRTYGNQIRNENGSRNRNNNDETEDEQPSNAPISSSSHSRSPKRLKTSPSGPYTFRSASASASGSAETETKTTTVKIKQEPGLSPSPSAVFAQIPMYNNGTINNTAAGYETAGDDNPPSSRSISPLTRVPTPRRLLFPTPTPNRSSTGTNSQLSLRGVSKQLKKVRNRQVALDREESREQSREQSRERRGEGFWGLAGGGGGGGGGSQAQGQSTAVAQDEEIGEWASPRQQQQQQQYRGSSEEKEEGWTTISGSSEEGEVSSHYENSYSYSCGHERDDDAAGNTHQSSPCLPGGDQEWCHPFSSSSTSPAPVPESSSSARYGPGSEPSLSASQERVEQYRQAIQMVQDTCLEASKRYIRAHCVNRGARGGGDSPDTCTLSHETAENRSARKARRKRKLETRHAFCSSSIFSSSSPSPPPSRRRRKNRKRTTTTPPSSPSSPSSSQFHDSITCTDSLLPNISQICTLLWSRSQSLRLHDIDSIELHTARNMYWLLSWAETVAFAVPPTTPLSATNGRTSNTSEASSSSFLGVVPGVPSSLEEDLGARGRWHCRERDPEHAPSCGDVLNGAGYMWRERDSEEEEEEGLGGIEVLESKNGAVCWSQQWDEMWRVFEEGGMLCEFLGYGEGVERMARVREFYGF